MVHCQIHKPKGWNRQTSVTNRWSSCVFLEARRTWWRVRGTSWRPPGSPLLLSHSSRLRTNAISHVEPTYIHNAIRGTNSTTSQNVYWGFHKILFTDDTILKRSVRGAWMSRTAISAWQQNKAGEHGEYNVQKKMHGRIGVSAGYIDRLNLIHNSARSHSRSARSHPHTARSHPLSARSHSRSARSHPYSARSHLHSARSHPHSSRSYSHLSRSHPQLG